MRHPVLVALAKAAIVLVPTYAVAFLTEKMVYVVPMVAAALIVASEVGKPSAMARRVDDDGGPDDADDQSDFPDMDLSG